MRHVTIQHFWVLFVQLLCLFVELAPVHVQSVDVAPVVRAFSLVEFVSLKGKEIECQCVNWNLEFSSIVLEDSSEETLSEIES